MPSDETEEADLQNLGRGEVSSVHVTVIGIA